MTPRGMTRFKVWLVLVSVFVLGCLTGAFLDSAYHLKAAGSRSEGRGGDGRHGTEEVFERMKRDLNLSEQQATEVRAILEQTRTEYRALRAEVRPRYDAVRQNARTRIRALLTPEQQQRFDVKAAERDARRAEDGRRDEQR